jgi:hypothetical protein
MANRLWTVLTFNNIAGGGGVSTQAHDLHVSLYARTPDVLWCNNSSFSITADATDVTVTNNAAGAESCNVLVMSLHSILRSFGSSAVDTMTPQPVYFTSSGGGGGGGGASVAQRFTEVLTGAEGSDFLVTLPVAMATDTYLVWAQLQGVTAMYSIDLPDLIPGDRTTTQFRVITTADVAAGDEISFYVDDPA